MYTIYISIESIHPSEGRQLFVCKEFSHLLETMSIHNLSYYRQHFSTLLLSLRFEKYRVYPFFIISVRNVAIILTFPEEPLALLGVASTPAFSVLSAGSDVSFLGSLLRPVQSLQLSFQW